LNFFTNFQILQISFNGVSGFVQWIKKNGIRHPLHQNFLSYKTFNTNKRTSGAYIFRPDNIPPLTISEKTIITIYRGIIFNIDIH